MFSDRVLAGRIAVAGPPDPGRWGAASKRDRRGSAGFDSERGSSGKVARDPRAGSGIVLNSSEIEAVFEEKRRRRRLGIERLRSEAQRSNEEIDPRLLALRYDLEEAPFTTNLRQLEEIGVDVPDHLVLEDEETGAVIDSIVAGLARIGVFLLHTDHLDDRELLALLGRRILREPVRDVPPGVGSREWIDLAGGLDRSAFLAVHADDAEREAARAAGESVPVRIGRRANRDHRLPRPVGSSTRDASS